MADFARRKGLLDHMCFYSLPPGLYGLQGGLGELAAALQALPGGQYFIVTHPALDTGETRQTGNAQISGEDVAKGRAYEAKLFSDPALPALLQGMGCEGIRYDEATPQKRASIEDIGRMLRPGNADGGENT